ncbi:NADH-quinone oxidoreductase subunit J [Opitutus sp. ER46]|uniref:NADH-quinone oxidoreductase subunit J family protein n=1 Tax=Opitutus sp. ER46 TaxID=2161864 RepID=UPI000D2FABF5|nr:NADH-quinone oxidoreductase subunit J [Opitutus sp. ER46]PTX95792.1 NADH-quinone oxidoreductase subunit J [Opitutus sp. ER46]
MIFLFNLLALFTVICAVGVVVSKNTVNGAMCLLLSLVGVAGLFVGLNAYLLAFLLLLVYAGAVVALFLFIVMLLDTKGDEKPRLAKIPLVARGLALALVLAGIASFYAQGRLTTPDTAAPALGSSLKLYAYQLFTTYLLPVQVMGFLLLIAMIGVIVVSRRLPAEGEQPNR